MLNSIKEALTATAGSTSTAGSIKKANSNNGSTEYCTSAVRGAESMALNSELTVFEAAEPVYERAIQRSAVDKTKKPLFSVQAKEIDVNGLQNIPLEQREQMLYMCPAKKKNKKCKPPLRVPTDEELGTLVSDRSACLIGRKIQAGFCASPFLTMAAYTLWKSKDFARLANYKWLLPAGLGVALCDICGRCVKADQLYHNENTKRFTYRYTPVVGDRRYVVCEEGFSQMVGAKPLKKFNDCRTTSGHKVDQTILDLMYAKSEGTESPDTEQQSTEV